MNRIYFVWWKIWWWLFTRPLVNYRIDRAFGWSRWRAVLRCWLPGKKLCYPPHIRKQMREDQMKESQK